jgi:hypothetical protein
MSTSTSLNSNRVRIKSTTSTADNTPMRMSIPTRWRTSARGAQC